MTNLINITRFIRNLIEEMPDTTTSMERIRNYLTGVQPKLEVDLLREVDYAGESEGMKFWLTGLFNKNPLPKDVKSLWLGLFEKVEDNEQSLCIYISGSKFAPQDDQSDWPTDTTYFPEGRYYIPKSLNRLYREIKKIKDSDSSNEIEVLVIVSLTCLLLFQTLPQIETHLLKDRKKLFIGTGYDEGDIFILGKLTENGWEK